MRCSACGTAGAEFVCSRCRDARFCNVRCQRSAWRHHKMRCKVLALRPDHASVEKRSSRAEVGVAQARRREASVYPNVGALHGEVRVRLTIDMDFSNACDAITRAVFQGAVPSQVRFFSRMGIELSSIEDLHKHGSDGIIVSSGLQLRCGAVTPDTTTEPQNHHRRFEGASRRYDADLVGEQVRRVNADDQELTHLLHCSVPLVISGSGLVSNATELWSFEYLEKHLSDVDNFFVLCAPAESKDRFAYYDFKNEKNPCGYDVIATNERVEMRFPTFRRKIMESQAKRQAGKPASSFYLQTALLYREESNGGPAKPVGGFGASCGRQILKDMDQFRWEWLKQAMGGRDVQMCQFFCGTPGGFSPCHYDPQDNIFAQIRGYKRVLLFHPKHFGQLYPWPVHHPQDRQSRVDFDNPDFNAFPRFSELRGQGLEAVLGPGDALHIPPGWWHHIEMLPSLNEEVVSINFWYPSPSWYYGDPSNGSLSWDVPIFGVKRALFGRAIEELTAQLCSAWRVREVISLLAQSIQIDDASQKETIGTISNFVCTVFPDAEERLMLLNELLSGRFDGLVPSLKRTA